MDPMGYWNHHITWTPCTTHMRTMAWSVVRRRARPEAKWREALAWLVRIDELQLPPGKAGDQGLNMSELHV